MTDTPRTDASCFSATTERPESGDYELEVVYSDFCRQLERELAEARKDADRYRWMRSHEWDSPIVKLGYDDYEHLMMEQLDAVVDAARTHV